MTLLSCPILCYMNEIRLKHFSVSSNVAKKLFRNEVQKVATERKDGFQDYCQKLLQLPEKISHCDNVKDFFTPRYEDVMLENEKKGEYVCIVVDDKNLVWRLH